VEPTQYIFGSLSIIVQLEVIPGAGTNYDAKRGTAEFGDTFCGADPGPMIEDTTHKASLKSFAELKRANVEDFASLTTPFQLSLPDSLNSSRVTMRRTELETLASKTCFLTTPTTYSFRVRGRFASAQPARSMKRKYNRFVVCRLPREFQRANELLDGESNWLDRSPVSALGLYGRYMGAIRTRTRSNGWRDKVTQ
jgi:hypothetical protein